MARLRLKGRSGVYHCYSRVVGKERLLDERCREKFAGEILRVAKFSGVEVLSWCVLSNHFHILLRVPEESAEKLSNRELLTRYRTLYPNPTRWQSMSAEVLEQHLSEGKEAGQKARRRLCARMHDLSQYMKTLKQRYSVWYNRTNSRVGTLWSERFGSTLVEGRRQALQIVSAYIDLNPVRAGLVNDPKDYRWSSYGRAVAGVRTAREGIMRVIDDAKSWTEAQGQYRSYLYCVGVMPGRGGEGAALQRRDWIREMARGGHLPVAVALRCRVRYFTCGAVIGSQAWVDEVYGHYRERFGPRRRSGAHIMKGSDWDGLSVLRNLQKEVFG